MNFSELSGAYLDHMVALAEGLDSFIERDWCYVYRTKTRNKKLSNIYDPSGDWWTGGVIIQRERISICSSMDGSCWWASAFNNEKPVDVGSEEHLKLAQRGDTPLIAAMRAYVASKFGDTVEDLVQGKEPAQ